jgi:histidinol dehydrogenase
MLVAAAEAGAREMYKAGGAQAIAALAYGTETIPRCDKVVGPGNRYVVAAKRLVFGSVGIESLPGPSETCVIADAEADPRYVAADLLSQAEHGPDSPAILITDAEPLLEAVERELGAQLPELPRAEAARESLAGYSAAVLVRDLAQAAEVANHIAPEHVQLMVRRPEDLKERIRHAGCIFLGEASTVPLGDYVAGPSHVLPTNRTARFSSPLSVADFVKCSSVVDVDAEGLEELADAAVILAEAEGLSGHARAIQIRRRSDRLHPRGK